MYHFYLFTLSLLISFFSGFFIIKKLKKLQFGQHIREEGPKSHQKKAGTPTIGGVIFLISSLIVSFVFLKKDSEFFFLLTITFGFGLVGFLDDFLKVVLKRNLGLTAKQKLFFQLIIAIVSYFILYFSNLDTHIYIPFLNKDFNLGWFYFVFYIFLLLGTTNATNLTDGLDGLLTSNAIIVISFYCYIAYHFDHTNISLFAIIFVGALTGFLLHNKYPAKVFMGDTGSLAIGGFLVGISIVTKTEILLALIGIVFVIETLSVILQVASFKLTKKRIFKMSPLHHHFELSGWGEIKIVSIFSLISFIVCLLSLFII